MNIPSLNNKIYNNTVLGYGDSLKGWPTNYNFNMSGTEIRNNIFTGVVDCVNVKGAVAPTFGVNIFNATPPIGDDFVPIQNSTAVDTGEILAGYADFSGAAPDQGAYEYGGEYWVPGAVDEYPTLQGKLGLSVTNGIMKISPSQTIDFGANDIRIDKLATGGTIKLYYFGELFDSASVVLSGDINGDGAVNSLDLLMTKKYLLKISMFDQFQIIAANLDNDNIVSAIDLLMLKKYLLGMINIQIIMALC